MKHFSTSEARKNFSQIINRVKYEKIIISIGRHNKTEALIIPSPEIDENLPITAINAASDSFNFLQQEPELYSLKDLKKRYV